MTELKFPRTYSKKTQSYWQENLTLIHRLLMIWAFFSFGTTIVLAKFLNHFEFGRLPLGFWMAQQGALLVFVALIFVYAFKMSELDRIHDLKNEKGDQNSSGDGSIISTDESMEKS